MSVRFVLTDRVTTVTGTVSDSTSRDSQPRRNLNVIVFPEDAKKCMEWMRVVLANRLKNNPAQFGAKGATTILDVMKAKLFTPRRDVFFFGTPAGDDRFSYPNFPNYSEDDSLGYYGFRTQTMARLTFEVPGSLVQAPPQEDDSGA